MTLEQFEQFYDANAAHAYGLARSMLHSDLEAQAVLQEAFLVVWESGARSQPPEYSRDALLREVRERSCARLSSGARAGALDARNPALDGLPRETREVTELACYHGLKVCEVADCLQLPHEDVRARMHEGMRGLRSQLS